MKKILVLFIFALITTTYAAPKKNGGKIKIDAKISTFGLQKGVVYIFDNKSDCTAFMRIGTKCLKYKGNKATLFASYKKKLKAFLEKNKKWTAVKVNSPFKQIKWGATVIEIAVNEKVEVSSGKTANQQKKAYLATLDTWRPKASGSVGGGGC